MREDGVRGRERRREVAVVREMAKRQGLKRDF